jgi:hypothetical protein
MLTAAVRRITSCLLFGVALTCSFAIKVQGANQTEHSCKSIWRSDGFMAVKVSLSGSGRFCLMEDLLQRNVRDLIDGRNRGSPGKEGVVGLLEARDLDFDFQGHLASGLPFENITGINIRPTATYITIRNGIVKTPGPFGIGVWAINYKHAVFDSFAEEDIPPLRSTYNKPGGVPHVLNYPWDYQPATNYLLDALKIQSGGRGVILAGDGNTLRNSTVDVDGAVAAYFYGPNAVIEGNTFIVHRTADEYIPATSAILKLRDADNAIIRNNRFIFKGGSFSRDQAEAAINLLTSKNVRIENNSIEGVKAFVRKDDATTTLERGNVSN